MFVHRRNTFIDNAYLSAFGASFDIFLNLRLLFSVVFKGYMYTAVRMCIAINTDGGNTFSSLNLLHTCIWGWTRLPLKIVDRRSPCLDGCITMFTLHVWDFVGLHTIHNEIFLKTRKATHVLAKIIISQCACGIQAFRTPRFSSNCNYLLSCALA